ncbi:hypothetical protein [Massilia sp. TWR1-2-2]|uniref:hypothetical protein n=1 Tax=Massilia sp. TWR1-2-2 TaxID=2804584 RepID=UPI003CFB0352
MAGDALAALKQLERVACRARVRLRPGVQARHRVKMAIDLDVSVDADRRHFSFRVFIPALGHRTQGWLVHLGECADAAAGQFLDGRWFRSVSSMLNAPVQFVATEEALVVSPRQHAALDYQHAVLDLGLVLGRWNAPAALPCPSARPGCGRWS